MITPVSFAWARSEAVITPPCHGGDRRFKSGRARHLAYVKIPPNMEVFYYYVTEC